MEVSLNKMCVSDKIKSVFKELLHLVIKIAVIILCIRLILIFIFGVYRLSGNSMYPALKDGDLCVTYKLDNYYADDVVAYYADGRLQFGRIIAREGDMIDGDAEGLLLNGARIAEEIFYATNMLETNLELPITLKENEFIILNDYREDNNDSRTYGIITEDLLEGKIIFIFRRRGF